MILKHMEEQQKGEKALLSGLRFNQQKKNVSGLFIFGFSRRIFGRKLE
jgi:hypothetical protein